jgi:hypothetical protein
MENIRLLGTPKSPDLLIELLNQALDQAKEGHLTDLLIIARQRGTGSLTHWRSLDRERLAEFLGGLMWTAMGLCMEMGYAPVTPEPPSEEGPGA